MFRAWILQPQLQDRRVPLHLCSGGHPTRATSLETTPHRGEQQTGRGHLFSLLRFRSLREPGHSTPEDCLFLPPNVQRPREGK